MPPPLGSYVAALARPLIDDLAASNPAVAAGIARRAIGGLRDKDDRPIGTAIACRLLAKSVQLELASVADDLRRAMTDNEIDCPKPDPEPVAKEPTPTTPPQDRGPQPATQQP